MSTRMDASSPAFVVGPNEYGEWGWCLITGSGRVLARSGMEYESRADCEDAVDLIRRLAPVARFDRPDSSRAAFLGSFDMRGTPRAE
ncbi:MAG: YegP family protein [Phycisphaeraceae bacterium]|nr:YegP family protein [Phycisphaeraceae bacterium]